MVNASRSNGIDFFPQREIETRMPHAVRSAFAVAGAYRLP
jgi:hypothetical protein